MAKFYETIAEFLAWGATAIMEFITGFKLQSITETFQNIPKEFYILVPIIFGFLGGFILYGYYKKRKEEIKITL